uniref:Uncharacterized protein n=1 Tax=Anguilla anguilla TaxID=7936 RepID=A0A0E9XIT1_ANGAN
MIINGKLYWKGSSIGFLVY